MTTSLHSFCKAHDLAKSTVHRWLNDEGYTTTGGLSEDAIAAAREHFCKPEPAPEPITEVLEPAQEPLEVTVLGTCTPTMEAPTFNSSVALARLRGGSGEIAAYADPMAAISQALSLFDAAESAMAADLAQRQALLQQTQTAARAMAAKAAQLQAQQAEYKIKSDVMAMLQNQETANLGELLGKAAALAGEPS